MSHCAPCAPFYEENPLSWYNLCLEGFFALGLLINLYIIYCILRRSPKNISTYKWYLLYHQIITVMADIGYNYIARPVMFLPFSAGYPMSLFCGIVSTHLLIVYCLAGTIYTIATIVHLFWFRYLTVRRLNHPPLHYWIRLSLLYLTSAIFVFQHYQNAPDIEAVVESLSKEYLCIDKRLLQIEGFIIYDWNVSSPLLKIIGFSWTFFCMFEISYLIIFSLRETTVANMSPQLAKLNRQFLIQLIVQAATPFCIIAVPFNIYGLAVAYQASFVGQGFGHIITVAIASFSSTSGVALVIMTPSYRPAFRRKKIVKPAASASITLSKVTRL